jgi:hypothetical protein
MNETRVGLLAAFVGLLSVVCTTKTTTPNTTTDAGTVVDAGTATDAGTDAGAGADAGTEADAGSGAEDAGASALMSFFVTSVGMGLDGGSFGGLAGADAKCTSLIQAAIVPASVKARTWRAYLSTTTVTARTRIGAGPWYNLNGALVAQNLTTLHANGISYELILTEIGTMVASNDHDILTGADADGGLADPVATCADWTANDSNTFGQVGHVDWNSPSTVGNPSWNSSHSTSCDQAGLASTAGSGRTYCFAE